MQKGACRNEAQNETQKVGPKTGFDDHENAQFDNFSIGF